ncbi:transcriptional regulator [Cohnella kolymensis]|uniref:Transcriptional regulator n=1 Tax=Cohnella kolymensis TaxID=1590652 RepID=A0ABR5A0Q6_9BACL|nr:LCP family protein [Cohnella kolymensis]KIL34629.1 transcriptional regulator [Cohnella kolymensis]
MSYDMPLSSRSANRRPNAPKKKKVRWGRIVSALLGLVILALACVAGYLYWLTDKNLDKVADPNNNTVASADKAQVKPISLVLLGLDNRPEIHSLNTDVMMVAAFNPKTKTATVVSIPRDSLLNLEGYKRQKANAYYAGFHRVGSSEQNLEGDALHSYARDKVREMLEKFTGVPIDYSAVIDFQGFVDVVDALGGVKVNVDQDMRYADSADGTDINLTMGEQTLDGKQALGFVRYRKSKSGPDQTRPSNDFERNARQSQVLGAIVDRIKSFGGATKLDGVINAAGDNMRTDIPKAQIENIISTYFGINRSDIRFIPLTGEWHTPYVELDEAKIEEAKRALAEELQPEGRTRAAPAASPSASDNG